MKVYISGPITGHTNFRERFAAAEELLKMGNYEVVNPAEELAELPTGTSHEIYMDKSLELLSECDGIYMLDGWENSRGAHIEFEYAIRNKMTVCFEKAAR
jgi:hypothetical protein